MAKEIVESLASTLILKQKSGGTVNTLTGTVRSSTSRSGGHGGSERKSFPQVSDGGGGEKIFECFLNSCCQRRRF